MKGSNEFKRFIQSCKTWGTHYSLKPETMERRARDHWWPVLKPHGFDDVEKAINRAHTHNLKGREPDRMFTLAAVEVALSAILREKKEDQRAAAARLEEATPANTDGPQFHPLSEAQQKWVDEAANPLTRLGRRWECEESNRIRPMTNAEGSERAREYREAIDENGDIL